MFAAVTAPVLCMQASAALQIAPHRTAVTCAYYTSGEHIIGFGGHLSVAGCWWLHPVTGSSCNAVQCDVQQPTASAVPSADSIKIAVLLSDALGGHALCCMCRLSVGCMHTSRRDICNVRMKHPLSLHGSKVACHVTSTKAC